MIAGLIGVILRTAGAPALRRAGPVYMGVLLVAAVLFGPNGMHPRTLAAGVRASADVRLGLLVLWLVALAPAARALIREPGLDYLRWLPAARRAMPLVLGALLLALQAPLAALLCLGADIRLAAATLLLSAGVHALVALSPRTRLERVRGLAALAVAALMLARWPDIAWLAFGAALLCACLPRAVARAPERHVHRGAARLLPGRVLALAQVQLLGLVREHPAVLVRGALLAALGAGATVLMARANAFAGAELATVSAVVATVFLTAGSVAVAAPLAEKERALAWLLDSRTVRHDARMAARLVLGLVLGASYGLLYAALVSWAVVPDLALAARILAGAAATAVAVIWLTRRLAAAWPDARSARGARVVGVLVLVLVAELLALTRFGDIAVVAFLVAAFALSWERA